jgi:CxxC motif-containing protein
MERKMVCISCPLGCRLTVTWEEGSEIRVNGNKCAKGESYAQEEILAPKRVVTATVAVAVPPASTTQASAARAIATTSRRLPVKTSAPLLKEHIPALLNELYKMRVKPPLSCGDTLLKDFAGSGVDLLAARSLKEG